MRRWGESALTIKDLKNILLWYERMNAKHEDLTTSDNRTQIKIQAMLIYEEEDEEKENTRYDRFR
jgi:hypothetical protein